MQPLPQPQFFNLEYIYYRIYQYTTGLGLFAEQNGHLVFTGQIYLYYARLVLIFIAVYFTLGIISIFYKLYMLRKEEWGEMMDAMFKEAPPAEKKNERWEAVQKMMTSASESDWKLAIIEADKMLDELLSVIGYQGDTIGDKLQAVQPGDMLSLNDAWDAHKARNQIAHEAGYRLSLHTAKIVIAKYEKVFHEFEYI